MSIIKDATGKGFGAGVTSENRICVDSSISTLELHVNKAYAKYFSLPFDAIDPVGADDYFFYIKNTGTKDINVTDFRIRSTVAGTVEIHTVSGTASFTSGTDVAPVNRKVGNANTLDATIKTDTDTTGLVNGGIYHYMRLAVVDTEYQTKFTGQIILPPGQAIAMLWDQATGALTGSVSVFEDPGVS